MDVDEPPLGHARPMTEKERTLFQTITASIPGAGAVLLDHNYHLLWMNPLQENVLKSLRGHSLADVVGKHCYEVWNGFDANCRWCPVSQTLVDGELHLDRSASPDNEHAPALNYFHIVSFPLSPLGDPDPLVMEIIFMDQGNTTRVYARLVTVLAIANQLGEMFPYVRDADLFIDLVMLGLFHVLGDHVTAIDAYRCDTASTTDPTALATRHRRMTKKRLPDLNGDFLKQMVAAEGQFNTLWPRFAPTPDRINSRLVDLVGIDRCAFLPNSDWFPARLDSNTLAVWIPSCAQDISLKQCWLLVVTNTEKNTFLLRDDFSDATLFLSSVHRHADLLAEMQRSKSTQVSLQKRLDEFNLPHFEDAVPFALGKGHELGHLIKIQQEELTTLKQLLTTDVRQKLDPHLARLQAVADALTNLRRSLGSLKDLASYYLQSVNLKQLLDKTLSYAVQTKKTAAILINRSYQQHPELVVRADETLLEQVIFNLVDNSIKALKGVTHRVPTITITTRELDAGHIEIVVEDNGTGIHPDDLPKVFDRYFTTYAKGTGLGLYYSRVIVKDIHEGTIDVKSRWGFGATFTICLPSP